MNIVRQHIPVAYATANDYEYTVISILSILENADREDFYNFYILIDNDFLEDNKKEFVKCFRHHKSHCKISFKNVGDIFNNVYLKVDFINRPTYFRLLLPELLEEEKCIYLDSDTVICGDLRKLLEFDFRDYYVAGVKAPWYVLKADKAYYCKQALLPNMEQYINAGVLLLNLTKMRKDNIVEKMLALLPYNMDSQDQDIINSACYGRIKFLPFRYNVMTKYASWPLHEYADLFSENELKTAWNNPQIIHYADRVKPWNSIDCVMGDYWWNMCRKSCMWDYFYGRMEDFFFSKIIYQAGKNEHTITTKKICSLFDFRYKNNIVIYGAGNRAVKLINYLREHNIEPQQILVSDKRNNPNEIEGIDVKELKDIDRKNTDRTIIIATLEMYHMEIMCQLYQYGFREIVPLDDRWE